MKHCRILLIFCIGVLFCLQGLTQEATKHTLPTDGRVEGSAYRNSHFGFTYYIPEQWAARGTPGKLPGVANGYLLLTLKKTSGDSLSSVTLSAAELSEKFKGDGDVLRYLDERYRLHQEAALSETTINGIRAGKSKAVDREPESVIIGDRQFYKVEIESTGMTRVAMATTEKGCALVFELTTPTRYAPETTAAFMDSMLSLTFAAPVSVGKK